MMIPVSAQYEVMISIWNAKYFDIRQDPYLNPNDRSHCTYEHPHVETDDPAISNTKHVSNCKCTYCRNAQCCSADVDLPLNRSSLELRRRFLPLCPTDPSSSCGGSTRVG